MSAYPKTKQQGYSEHMAVTLCVHMEMTEEGAVWWADSEQVEGFSAAASSLQELTAMAKHALVDMMSDGELDEQPILVHLVEAVASSSNPTRAQVDAPVMPRSPGANSRVLVG